MTAPSTSMRQSRAATGSSTWDTIGPVGRFWQWSIIPLRRRARKDAEACEPYACFLPANLYLHKQAEKQEAIRKRAEVRAEVGLPAWASDAELAQQKAELEAKLQARAEVGLPATASDAELAQRKEELEAKRKARAVASLPQQAMQSWRNSRKSSLPRILRQPSKHGK